MIENIKTNQIGKFCKGDIKCTKKSPGLFFVPFHHLCAMCSPVIITDNSQMSLFNHSKTVRARDLKF